MLEVPSDEAPGTIVQELQPGYMIKDRLLRPALVGVAKKPD
jgi:molecular chaperone GrpE